MTDNNDTRRDLILNVKNFGPIAEAKDIEIKPMTVFVGPSNTGKSYLAILLHAISQARHTVLEIGSPLNRSLHEDADHYQQYDDEYSSLATDIGDFILDKYGVSDEKIFTGLNPDSKRLMSIFEEDTNKGLVDTLNHSMSSFFEESDIRKLSTNGYGDLKIQLFDHTLNWSLACDDSGFGEIPHNDLSDAVALDKFSEWIQQRRLVHDRIINIKLDVMLDDSLSLNSKVIIHNYFQSAYLDIYRNISKSIYFPASRTGIMASYRLLNMSIIKDAETNRLASRNRIVIDFFEHLLGFHTSKESGDELAVQVAEVIEQSLVSGRVMPRGNQYASLEFTYSTDDIDIPISRSSAMVTELAPIILFLKGFINIGDLLIIEEPEAHLHPAAQQKMAAALAFMVRSGLRVLITTHSHYMVEQISNFVGASSLSPEKRRELLDLPSPMNEHDVYLDEDEVGMYGFDDSSGRTEVKPIPYDDAYAYVPEDHSIALNEQFNRNIRIMRARRNGHNGSINGL